MLLTNPSVEELQNLELASLIDMLAHQTAYYTKYIKDHGFTHESECHRQLLVNIQAAVERKESFRKNQTESTVPVNQGSFSPSIAN